MNQQNLTALLVLKWLVILVILGWVMWRCLKRSEDDRLISKWIATVIVLPVAVFVMISTGPFIGVPVAAFLAIILGAMWAPNIGGFMAASFTSIFDGGMTEVDSAPFYSIAEARRKRGRYDEAIAEVRKQLEKFPNDFQGWLLLAQIQADDLKDLRSAQLTVERIVNQSGHAPKNVAHALTRLADWQLKLGQNIEEARQSLERIGQLFPDTELAQLAAQRIAHLTGPENMARPHEPRRIQVPGHAENLGLCDDFTGFKIPAEDLTATAGKYVGHLEQYPLDYEAREKLAILYAEHFRRLDLATDQLEQLIAYPNQPVKKVVQWLNLLADLQVQHSDDPAAPRKTLQRIIDRYPHIAAAENARQRLGSLNLEFKRKQTSQVVKLGSYEQRIGLKKDWPSEDSST
ncbi:MAG: tetratricopeptide repeat protein [Verrucomicrobiota bacterium]